MPLRDIPGNAAFLVKKYEFDIFSAKIVTDNLFITQLIINFAAELKNKQEMMNCSNLLHIIIIRLQRVGGSDKVCT